MEHGSVLEAARATGRSGEILACLEGLREAAFNSMQNSRGTASPDRLEGYEDQIALLDSDISRVRAFHYSTGTPPLTPGGSYVGRMGATI